MAAQYTTIKPTIVAHRGVFCFRSFNERQRKDSKMNDVILKKLESGMSVVKRDGLTKLLDQKGNLYLSGNLWFTTKSWGKGMVSIANHEDNMILLAFDTEKYEKVRGTRVIEWMDYVDQKLDFVELSTCWMFLK